MPTSSTPLPPLAERVRPQRLEDYTGQQHIIGPGGPLRALLEAGQLPSLLLWGPPGVGKTTLVRLLAHSLGRPLRSLSAVQAGVREVRSVLEEARMSPGTLLFIDEIHRFNKAQQDALLHAVEAGTITFIGATTENPSFEVIPALRSRCQLYVLQELTQPELVQILQRALATDEVLKTQTLELAETEALYHLSGGDARKALNLLELVAGTPVGEGPNRITNERVQRIAQQKTVQYDKDGEQHYDQISAFIKAIRGGDPNGALYWMARMLAGGEDPLFIARRLIISASEDIGNANPNALLLAVSTFQAVERIGLPEGRIPLAQAATYLATSPKSNAAYMGINRAMQAVQQNPNTPVPLHLRNAPTKLMKDQGYGQGYKYSHDYQAAGGQGQDGNQEYLPQGLEGTAFYQPKPIGREADIALRMATQWGNKYKEE